MEDRIDRSMKIAMASTYGLRGTVGQDEQIKIESIDVVSGGQRGLDTDGDIVRCGTANIANESLGINEALPYLNKQFASRERARQAAEEDERMRQNCIRKGICPTCQSELIRGKRNKKNDYKREWGCTNCFSVHTI